MSSVEKLREFINERLTTAAEEIFGAFKDIIIKYEEIDCQRKLLEDHRTPEIKLHRLELPPQHVSKEDGVPSDQQLWNLERDSLMDQEDSEALQVKEEQEELCVSYEEEQLEVKQETDAFLLTPTDGGNYPSEGKAQSLNPDERQGEAQKDSAVNIPFIISVLGGPNSDQLLSNNSLAVKQDQRGETCEKNVKLKSKSNLKTNTGEMPYNCQLCGKAFKKWILFYHHMRIHSGEGPYIPHSTRRSRLKIRMQQTPTGEKPYVCKICAKIFIVKSDLTVHMRTHTGERPYTCNTCGKGFRQSTHLKVHITTVHNNERPYTCETCGKDFKRQGALSVHTRTHTDEKPYICSTCGRDFRQSHHLKDHIRALHNNERPYICETCGKEFRQSHHFKYHMRTVHNEAVDL